MLPLLLLVVVLLLDHLIRLNDNPFTQFTQFAIDPLIGAGLVSGAASLVGNVLGIRSSNSKNMQINKMNNDFNAAEAEKARRYQSEMWNKTNDWNSPKNVRKRLEEAGYNPYLGLDSSNVGTAQSTGSSAYHYYCVRSGDTLSAVFGASWQRVASLNGLSNPNLIYPNQILKY